MEDHNNELWVSEGKWVPWFEAIAHDIYEFDKRCNTTIHESYAVMTISELCPYCGQTTTQSWNVPCNGSIVFGGTE